MSLGFAERTCHCTYGEDQGGGKDDSKDRDRDKFKGKDEGKNTDNGDTCHQTYDKDGKDNSKDYSKGKGTDSNDNEDTDSMDKDKDNSKSCSKPTPSENENKTTDSMAKDNSKSSSNQFPQQLAPWSYDPCTDKSKLSDTHSSNDDNTDTDCEQQVQSPPFAYEVPMPRLQTQLPIPLPPPKPISFEWIVAQLDAVCTNLPKSGKSEDESEPSLPAVPPAPVEEPESRQQELPTPDPELVLLRELLAKGLNPEELPAKVPNPEASANSSLDSPDWSVCGESHSPNSHSLHSCS